MLWRCDVHDWRWQGDLNRWSCNGCGSVEAEGSWGGKSGGGEVVAACEQASRDEGCTVPSGRSRWIKWKR